MFLQVRKLYKSAMKYTLGSFIHYSTPSYLIFSMCLDVELQTPDGSPEKSGCYPCGHVRLLFRFDYVMLLTSNYLLYNHHSSPYYSFMKQLTLSCIESMKRCALLALTELLTVASQFLCFHFIFFRNLGSIQISSDYKTSSEPRMTKIFTWCLSTWVRLHLCRVYEKNVKFTLHCVFPSCASSLSLFSTGFFLTLYYITSIRLFYLGIHLENNISV